MKNNIKKIVALCVACSLLFTLMACGGANIKVDVAKMGQDLSKLSIFSSELIEVNQDQTIMKYMQGNLQSKKDVSNAVSYASSGKSADEIAIFECAEGGNMANITNAITGYVRNQKLKFSSNHKETSKLNDVVIINKGNYAIVCVSKDAPQAKKFIKEYLSK